MVSKASAAGTAKKSTTTAAKKTAKKPTPKKASTATVKNEKISLIDKQVPVKENVNPVEKVLEIKAKNESKKAPKAVAKNARKAEVKTSVVSKKPVAAEKACPCCACTCKDGICASWVCAYKNMFNFNSRTSRYEFWGFMLLNFIFAVAMVGALVALISAAYLNTALTYISVGAMFAFIVIEAITYLSLSVRRLHDTGNTAWKGFFRPALISGLLFITLFIVSGAILNQLGQTILSSSYNLQLGLIAYLLLFLIVGLFALYYSLKVIMVMSFFDEDEDNIYGKSCYADKMHKTKAFKYAIIYFTMAWIFNVIYETVYGYMLYGHMLAR